MLICFKQSGASESSVTLKQSVRAVKDLIRCKRKI